MMNDMEETNEGQLDSPEDSRKKRIHLYKTILNYYKGKSFSLDVVLASKQQDVIIPPEMKNYKAFLQNLSGLHNDISMLKSLKECLKLIHNSLTCSEIMATNDFNLLRKIMNKIEGITYLSKLIMKIYSERYSELDLIEKKKQYITYIDQYGKNLDKMRENQKEVIVNDESTLELEKAELQVYKINLTRAMKAILIGFISVNHPDLFPQVKQFMNPTRRNLTIDDFKETWDVGL